MAAIRVFSELPWNKDRRKRSESNGAPSDEGVEGRRFPKKGKARSWRPFEFSQNCRGTKTGEKEASRMAPRGTKESRGVDFQKSKARSWRAIRAFSELPWNRDWRKRSESNGAPSEEGVEGRRFPKRRRSLMACHSGFLRTAVEQRLAKKKRVERRPERGRSRGA